MGRPRLNGFLLACLAAPLLSPGLAAAAESWRDAPAPIAEIAAASSRATSASPASSIVGYANLHDPRVFNGLATPDRTNRSLDGLIPAGEAPPDVEVARAAAANAEVASMVLMAVALMAVALMAMALMAAAEREEAEMAAASVAELR